MIRLYTNVPFSRIEGDLNRTNGEYYYEKGSRRTFKHDKFYTDRTVEKYNMQFKELKLIKKPAYIYAWTHPLYQNTFIPDIGKIGQANSLRNRLGVTRAHLPIADGIDIIIPAILDLTEVVGPMSITDHENAICDKLQKLNPNKKGNEFYIFTPELIIQIMKEYKDEICL